MNISLPDSLKSFVGEQVACRGYDTSSEYVRELIRADQDRQCLRKLFLDGAASPMTTMADEAYFTYLRDRVSRAKDRLSRKPVRLRELADRLVETTIEY